MANFHIPTTSQKLLYLAVSTLLATPTLATTVTCNISTGCFGYYNVYNGTSNPWVLNKEYSTQPDGDLTLNVAPGNYKNTPATESGIYDYIYHPKRFFEINARLLEINARSYDKDIKGTLNIPENTHIVQETSTDASQAISGEENTKINIAKNTSITINAGYAEQNNEVLPSDWSDSAYDAGDAINLRAGTVDTAADLILNGEGATGIYADKSTVDTHDHKIVLNGKYTEGLVTENSNITFTNVDITGAGSSVAFALVADKAEERNELTVTNTNVLLSNAASMVFANQDGTANIAITDSNLAAEIGIWDTTNEEENYGPGQGDHNYVLTNTKLVGRNSLLEINMNFPNENFGQTDMAFKHQVNITADNSVLYGKTVINPESHKNGATGSINMNLKNNSQWTLNGDSELDTLAVNNSDVIFDNVNGFSTLTINDKLSGNGRFTLNTDLASETGDKILVKGNAEGSHKLIVKDSKNEPSAANGSLTIVETGGGNATFNLENATNQASYVDAGAFRYELQKAGTNWRLAHLGNAADNTTDNTKNGVIIDIETPANNHKTLSAYSNSRLSDLQNASQLIQEQQNGLNHRLDALHKQSRSHGLWADTEYRHSHTDSEQVANKTYSSGYKRYTGSLQIGYDEQLSNNAYLGALVSYSRSHIDYQKDYADDTLRAGGVGLYGGITFGDNWFSDATYRYTKFSADNALEDEQFHSNTVNVQLGKSITLSPQWTLTRQLGITYGKLSGNNFIKDGTIIQTRAGASIEGSYPIGKTTIRPNIGLYYLGDHDDYTVGINQYNFIAPAAGNRVALEAGVDVVFGTANELSFALQTEQGSHTDSPISVNLGYRYSW